MHGALIVQDKRKIRLAIGVGLIPILLFIFWLFLGLNSEVYWGFLSPFVFIDVIFIAFAVGSRRIEFYDDHIRLVSGLTRRNRTEFRYSDVFIGRVRVDYNPWFFLYLKGKTSTQGSTTIYWPSTSPSSPLQVFNVRFEPLGLTTHQWLIEKGALHASPEVWQLEGKASEHWSLSQVLSGKIKLKTNLSRFQLFGSLAWFLTGAIILALSYLLQKYPTLITIGFLAMVSGPYLLWYFLYKCESQISGVL